VNSNFYITDRSPAGTQQMFKFYMPKLTAAVNMRQSHFCQCYAVFYSQVSILTKNRHNSSIKFNAYVAPTAKTQYLRVIDYFGTYTDFIYSTLKKQFDVEKSFWPEKNCLHKHLCRRPLVPKQLIEQSFQILIHAYRKVQPYRTVITQLTFTRTIG
jgi:hypothetical protein